MLKNLNINNKSFIISRKILLVATFTILLIISGAIFVFSKKPPVKTTKSTNKQIYRDSSKTFPTTIMSQPTIAVGDLSSESDFLISDIAVTGTPTIIPTNVDWEQFNKELNESLKEVKSVVEPSYNYDSYYPIILSISDNNGQINKNSAFNKYPYISLPDVTVKIGDVIRCKVQANDPKDRQILYYFFSNSSPFDKQVSRDENGKQKFISNSEIEYTITEEDLKSVGGQRFEIHAAIKSDKEYLRIPSQGYDDTIELHYNILIPED